MLLASLTTRRTSRSAWLLLTAGWFVFGARGDQIEQHLVSLGGEFVDRLAVRFLEDALDDLLLKLRREIRVSKSGPPGGHAGHQGVHEMLDTALTAAEMPQQIGPHHSPPQA